MHIDDVSIAAVPSRNPCSAPLILRCMAESAPLRELFEQYVAVHENIPACGLRAAVNLLALRAAEQGLAGAHVLPALRSLFSETALNSAPAHQFALAYSFVFFTLRAAGARNLSVDVAIDGWTLVLRGRFRLLQPWCAFLRSKRQQRVTVSEDTWSQVLLFSRTIHEDLSNYDSCSAWPILLDEFVETMCSSSGSAQHHRRLQDVISPSSLRQRRGAAGGRSYGDLDGYAADAEGEAQQQQAQQQHSGSSDGGGALGGGVPWTQGPPLGRTLGPGSKRRAHPDDRYDDRGASDDDDDELGVPRMPGAGVVEVTQRLQQLQPVSKRTRRGDGEPPLSGEDEGIVSAGAGMDGD